MKRTMFSLEWKRELTELGGGLWMNNEAYGYSNGRDVLVKGDETASEAVEVTSSILL